jgi:amino acid transporter
MGKDLSSEQGEGVEVTESGELVRTVSDTWHGRHLVKGLRWYNGFVLALAVPIFLFPDLGGSAVQLGVVAVVAVWFLSSLMGLLQSNLYAELALMYANKTGSMASYAREAYDRYTPLVGPIVAWGYWFGWCVVLSINGILVGQYLQANVSAFQSYDPVLFPKIVGTVMLVLMMSTDYFGIKTGKKVDYVLGALTLVPIAIIIFGAYISGHFNTAHYTPVGIPGQTSLWGAVSLVMYWIYIAGWSSYATEAVATLSPEYERTLTDTPRALRSAGAFTLVTYTLIPIGLIGILGTAGIAAAPLTPFDSALKAILGGGAGVVVVFFVIAALILSAKMSATASVRALWQTAENGLTLTTFRRLNRYGMPDVAVFFTYAFNILLIWTVGSPIWIIAASNVGYVGAHIFNLGGYLLLRKDQPNAVRPIRYGPWAPYLAGVLLAINLLCMLVGAPVYGLQPLLSGLAIMVAFGLVLYVVRRYVQHVPISEAAAHA